MGIVEFCFKILVCLGFTEEVRWINLCCLWGLLVSPIPWSADLVYFGEQLSLFLNFYFTYLFKNSLYFFHILFLLILCNAQGRFANLLLLTARCMEAFCMQQSFRICKCFLSMETCCALVLLVERRWKALKMLMERECKDRIAEKLQKEDVNEYSRLFC